jgi:hypothetical protein
MQRTPLCLRYRIETPSLAQDTLTVHVRPGVDCRIALVISRKMGLCDLSHGEFTGSDESDSLSGGEVVGREAGHCGRKYVT